MSNDAPRKKTILVIDDRKDDRRLVKLLLSKYDIELIEAMNGTDGLDLAAKHHPKLILMDQMMPGKTGLETVHELRQNLDMSVNLRLKTVPVIMLSSRKFDQGFTDYLKMEGMDFHAKPVKSKLLLEQIEALIGPLPKKGAANPAGAWGKKTKSSWGIKQ